MKIKLHAQNPRRGEFQKTKKIRGVRENENAGVQVANSDVGVSKNKNI
jgi:hypothetical protein